MESFKREELRDYFRDDCVDAYRTRKTEVTDVRLGATVVYPVVLDDRLEILVAQSGNVDQFTVPITREALERLVREVRYDLADATNLYRRSAKKLYDIVVAPYRVSHLDAEPSRPVVFVPDAVLRTIPLGALHDGERFLVESFAIATTPSLELSDPRPLDAATTRMLAAGVSESYADYPALTNVPTELEAVASHFASKVLLNDEFSTLQLSQELQRRAYGIVHIASHAEMKARIEDSLILAHREELRLNELSTLIATTGDLDRPIELIVFSACETARGDERAALGLSGVAIRSGARSAIGTLWRVSDASSASLMSRFYAELSQPGTTRANALREAQLSILQDAAFAHPRFWAPFLLLNNWL